MHSNKNVKRYLLFTLLLFASAFIYNLLILPINLVAGGTNGLAIILNETCHISPSITIFVLCLILTIFGIFFLDFDDVLSSIFITIIYPFFVKFSEILVANIDIDINNVLLITIMAAIANGIISGLIFKMGFNIGGFSILGKILCKYKKFSVSEVNLVINLIIVLSGGCIFGFNMILYAIIYLCINKIVTDKFMFGISENKVFYIISDKYSEIVDFLRDELHHDVTLFDIIGKYSNKKMKMVICVVPNNQYYLVKEYVDMISDDLHKAFVFVSDSYEVLGQDLHLKEIN